ncbi:hypothetical protein T12_17128 [Trichinella patagoniensis]|uniref:Uncharacterized protein n=1 Tax=Trichinella patagoniensis TaxID=990121 RepID=A0A0V0ZTV7_9BILA|nr:hypothetical protein T12_17128 [Trichinella patagoniensis]
MEDMAEKADVLVALSSNGSVRPAIFDITGDPKKTEAADLAQAS